MIYPNDIEYMKTLRKEISLPVGNPIGRGCLVFLYSNSLDTSIEMMNVKKTFMNRGRYNLYFLNGRYLGKIGNKQYKYQNLKERLDIYKRVEKETGIIGY